MLLLFSLLGLFAQWLSGKILDSWFGDGPPFVVSINVEPVFNILTHAYPIASAAFLCVLFIALVQMASDSVRGHLPEEHEVASLSLATAMTGIVIARVFHAEFIMTGRGLHGDYLFATNALVTNRDRVKPVALTVQLRAKTPERDRVYRRTHVVPSNALQLPRGLPDILLESLHDDPINLAPTTGKTGLLAFRIPGTLSEAQIEELRVCPMELEFEDSLAGGTASQPVNRAKTRWRTLL